MFTFPFNLKVKSYLKIALKMQISVKFNNFCVKDEYFYVKVDNVDRTVEILC